MVADRLRAAHECRNALDCCGWPPLLRRAQPAACGAEQMRPLAFAIPSKCPHAYPIASPRKPQDRYHAAAIFILATSNPIRVSSDRNMPTSRSILVTSPSIHVTSPSIHVTSGSILQSSPHIAPTSCTNLATSPCSFPTARSINVISSRHNVPPSANKLSSPHHNVPTRRRSPSVLHGSHRRRSDAARRATFSVLSIVQ